MHYIITIEQMERIKRICEVSKNVKFLKELQELKPVDDINSNDEVVNIKQLDSVTDNNTLTDHLQKARQIKQDRLSQNITNAINTLKTQNKPINAYQIHKLTNIAYLTLKKHLEAYK